MAVFGCHAMSKMAWSKGVKWDERHFGLIRLYCRPRRVPIRPRITKFAARKKVGTSPMVHILHLALSDWHGDDYHSMISHWIRNGARPDFFDDQSLRTIRQSAIVVGKSHHISE